MSIAEATAAAPGLVAAMVAAVAGTPRRRVWYGAVSGGSDLRLADALGAESNTIRGREQHSTQRSADSARQTARNLDLEARKTKLPEMAWQASVGEQAARAN